MQPSDIPNEKTAKRIGNQASFIILALVFSCVVSFFFLFNVDKIKMLQTSIDLQFNGSTTTGTVISLEEFKSSAGHNAVFILTAEFKVDGQPYTVTGNAYYPTLDHSWQGELLDVIYDPRDPNIAMINTFEERWVIPLAGALP
ncbi:MAG TPA: DUF3592 domain-containing protein [Anaerolineales bacterium]|nr:DUF3592 domain-containing protein [Anaerolineales bacterium]